MGLKSRLQWPCQCGHTNNIEIEHGIYEYEKLEMVKLEDEFSYCMWDCSHCDSMISFWTHVFNNISDATYSDIPNFPPAECFIKN